MYTVMLRDVDAHLARIFVVIKHSKFKQKVKTIHASDTSDFELNSIVLLLINAESYVALNNNEGMLRSARMLWDENCCK